MKPEVTIITATFNSSTTLFYTIKSVLAQSFQDFEYLVIGDACTDDSEALVRGWGDPRLHWHNLDTNSGSQAFPNNAGLDLARGKYIAYIGHDDLWFPNHLSSLVPLLDRGIALAHSMYFLIGPEGLRNVYGAPGNGRNYSNFAAVPSSWMHRKTSQRWLDPEQLGRAVDNDFFWRWNTSEGKITCNNQLTLLKFPSPWWKLYSRKNNFPQIEFLKNMQASEETLLHELLLESASLLAERHTHFLTWQQWLKEGIRPFAFQLMTHYPNNSLLRWLFQRQRQLVRRARGLSKP